jgi:hypothetical protein
VGTARRFLPDGFGWGVAAGIVGAVLLVLAGDLGSFPGFRDREARAEAPSGDGDARFIHLAAMLPAGAYVAVDGARVETIASGNGMTVPLSAAARRIEVRDARGTLWSTQLGPETGDTLRAPVTGEITVECGPGSPRGALFVDGAAAGAAPGTVGAVAPGWHHLEIREGEGVLFETACETRGGEVSLVTVPRAPQRGRSKLAVRARVLTEGGFREAEGYAVRVDGGLVGSTPYETMLPGGIHSVRVDAPGRSPRVEVLPLEGGTTRYIQADFGAEERLDVRVLPPPRGRRGEPLALPVRVASEKPARLTRAVLVVLRNDVQGSPVEVPLLVSPADPRLYLAAVPESLTGSRLLLGYASCQDELGRRGDSELFAVELRP